MNISRSRRLTLPLLILALTLVLGLLTSCQGYKDPLPNNNSPSHGSPSSDSSEGDNTPAVPTTYTVTATNACGSPLSGVLITIYQDKQNGRSIVNGTTGEDGTYTFTAPKGTYCVTAIHAVFVPIIETASFEADATTLTIAIGDHPKNCPCPTDEETTVAEPDSTT